MAGPTGDIAAAIAAYHRASSAVLHDIGVWLEEARNPERRLLAWPRPAAGTQLDRQLSLLFNADVDVWLVLLKVDNDPRSPAWPPDPLDPKMQVLLRVMQRAMDAGRRAIVDGFGGLELKGTRAFVNGVVESAINDAWQPGQSRADAGRAVAAGGIRKRRAFRAAERLLAKKAKPKQ